jgi:hypothetical protein
MTFPPSNGGWEQTGAQSLVGTIPGILCGFPSRKSKSALIASPQDVVRAALPECRASTRVAKFRDPKFPPPWPMVR